LVALEATDRRLASDARELATDWTSAAGEESTTRLPRSVPTVIMLVSPEVFGSMADAGDLPTDGRDDGISLAYRRYRC
jgi:hypothetical protein